MYTYSVKCSVGPCRHESVSVGFIPICHARFIPGRFICFHPTCRDASLPNITSVFVCKSEIDIFTSDIIVAYS